MEVFRRGPVLSNQIGTNGLAIDIMDTAIGLIIKQELCQPGHNTWIEEASYNGKDDREHNSGTNMFHVDSPFSARRLQGHEASTPFVYQVRVSGVRPEGSGQ